MDITVLAQWGGPFFGALLAIAVAFREKSKRAALQAERELENEKQEGHLQADMMKRMDRLEGRVETQSEVIGAQAVQIATLSAEKLRLQEQVDSLKLENAAQQQQMSELASDNVRLSGRVVQLEREKADAELKAKLIKREYRVSLGLKPDSEPPKG